MPGYNATLKSAVLTEAKLTQSETFRLSTCLVHDLNHSNHRDQF